jgi:hypothetical protein
MDRAAKGSGIQPERPSRFRTAPVIRSQRFPSERERVHQDRTDLFVQLFAHELPRPVQPGLDGLRLDTEKVSRFLDTHSFDHSCNEHQAIGLRQIVRGLLDKLKNLPLRHCSFRVVGLCGQWKLNDLSLGSRFLQRGNVHGGAPMSQPPEGFIHGDAREPGGEARLAPIA